MCIFKWKRNKVLTVSKYLSIFILICVCGILYSCQIKNNENKIKFEQAGDQLTSENAGSNNIAIDESILIGEENAEENKFICVHIVGYVASPGVYEVREGARIYEVIRLAGGFLPDADESYLNLASIVFDGQKIQVLSKEESKTAKPFVSQTERETEKKLVNINTATKEQLMQLSGIGESRALSIIAYREKNGEFKNISDIMKVAGIKEAAFEKIKDYICVE